MTIERKKTSLLMVVAKVFEKFEERIGKLV